MKKQFGIAMIALSAAMAFTFTACNDDSSSAKGPEKVSKVEDLSAECEDGEEALVGDDEVLYTCTDGKWATEAKSSASKPKSSSSKVEEEDECDPDLENCDDDDENNKEEEVKSSSSKKPSGGKGDSGSGSGSGEGGSGSEEPETPKCTDTEEQLCVNGELVDKANVKECGEARYNSTTHFCYTDDIEVSLTYPYCPGKKTYTPMVGGKCGEDGNYYYSTTEGSFFEDLRNNKTYTYAKIGDQTWMTQNLNYPGTMLKSVTSLGVPDYYEYDWVTGMQVEEEYKTKKYAVENNHQGVCPNGWHLPTNTEWTTLLKENTSPDLMDDKFFSNADYNNSGFSAYNSSQSTTNSISFFSATNDETHLCYAFIKATDTPSAYCNNIKNSSSRYAVRCIQNVAE